jgi:hypothetical protein
MLDDGEVRSYGIIPSLRFSKCTTFSSHGCLASLGSRNVKISSLLLGVYCGLIRSSKK